jgi:hypothetical protein
VQDGRGHDAWQLLVLREEIVELLAANDAAEPAERRDQHELQLRRDGACDAKEHVVEPAVVEMVLYPRAADPPDTTVDDHDLAVLDAP